MREYLYRIQPVRTAMLADGPTAEEERAIKQHFEYLSSLTARCVVILAGRTLNTDASSFGIVVYRAKDDEAARRIMEHDPAVAAGVFRAQLFPYRVALMSGPATGRGGDA